MGDWLTTPKGIKRPDAEQQAVDVRTQKLALYQFKACPFCIKARRAIKRLSLNIQTRDALRDARHRQELLDGGGELKVPCLRIVDERGGVTWMYESDDITDYLQAEFGEPSPVAA